MSVAIMGAGAFGTALAITLASKGPVTLWSHDPTQAEEMRQRRENTRRLPGVTLPEEIQVTSDTKNLSDLETVLLAIPLQKLRSALLANQGILTGKTLVACCKGIELASQSGPVQILAESVPNARHALLTGPSFARDIAVGLPTALALACADADTAKALQQGLSTPTLRLYTTTDVRGAELGGALKNVIAIACGAVMGAGLGESARAALMTRGFAEMQRLAKARGADPRTLAGLSGFGDLTLTCSSAQSRNYQMGFALGSQSGALPEATVEGIATAKAVASLSQTLKLDLPITQTVSRLAHGEIDVQTVIDTLLTRPLKEE